jgi:hypothetical protein
MPHRYVSTCALGSLVAASREACPALAIARIPPKDYYSVLPTRRLSEFFDPCPLVRCSDRVCSADCPAQARRVRKLDNPFSTELWRLETSVGIDDVLSGNIVMPAKPRVRTDRNRKLAAIILPRCGKDSRVDV